MKAYRVEIAPAVRKQLERIPKSDQRKILNCIEELGTNPRPNGYKKLVGFPNSSGVASATSKSSTK